VKETPPARRPPSISVYFRVAIFTDFLCPSGGQCACRSIAISAHAFLKSRFGTSRPSLSHAKALRRYFSEIFMIGIPIGGSATLSVTDGCRGGAVIAYEASPKDFVVLEILISPRRLYWRVFVHPH
jgi:hypothetical protein